MFTADNVEVKVGKYQTAGVNEEVKITDISLVELANGTKVIEMKTINENNQEGKSKRLYLDTTVKAGNTTSAWTISAKYLVNIVMAAKNCSVEEAKTHLRAENESALVKNLNDALLGKPFRGLFSSKEYQPGKFAIELYSAEPKGGTRLVFDPSNRYMNSVLPKMPEDTGALPTAKAKDDLPF